MKFNIYLSGEIHSDWREQIITGCSQENLEISFSSPVTNHEASDAAGDGLGSESDFFWRDHKSAKVNAIRTKTQIEKCDLAIIRFGDKYKQWNAAFDAGYAAALGKPIIVMHAPELTHPLKEIDGAAQAVTETPEQVVEILKYTLQQQ